MTNYRGIKCSETLYNLCVLLEAQHDWIADPSTFKRTYAGCQLKAGGAFSWTMMITDESGYKKQIGSQEPLKNFARKDIIIDVDRSWGDIAIWATNHGVSHFSKASGKDKRFPATETDEGVEIDIDFSRAVSALDTKNKRK